MPRYKAKTKRKFYGNRFTKAETEVEDQVRPDCHVQQAHASSSTAKKLQLSGEPLSISDEDNVFNLIISSHILKSIIDMIARCSLCHSEMVFENNLEKRKVLSCCLVFNCKGCDWTKEWFTSPPVKRKQGTPGPQAFDLNIRMVFAFREIGKGYKAMSTFSNFMNLPPPMAKNTYKSINNTLHQAYESVAEESMQAASKELHQLSEQTSEIKDCQVSVDGTWQKRGHSSLNGVISVISSKIGKCLDVAVMSKFCKSCQHWSEKKDHPAYKKWAASHVCMTNHTKSSGAMESLGALSIFQRSVEKYNLRYLEYIGDGDSSSFQEVENSKPYGNDISLRKLECIGHVQKRVGSRCRNLRKTLKGAKLSDGKGISGRGRLTDKAINTLQNYYGMAIRSNTDDINAMKRAVGAVLFHCSDVQLETERHKFCPTGENSWCKWQSDRVTGRNEYKKKLNLPGAIKEHLQPIFSDLSSEDLLTKCLHGLTQNANEALNNVIWKKCPKRSFVERNILEIATFSALIEFNDGQLGICKVAEKLGLSSSFSMIAHSYTEDKIRIKESIRKSTEKVKKRRKKLRAVRKGFIDLENEQEKAPSYKPGSF